MRNICGFLLALALIAAGCRPQVPAPTPTTDARGAGADAVVVAYQLILQHSVDPTDPAAIAAAGVKGLRSALLESGVTPPDIAAPAFGADAGQDAVMLRETIQAALDRYSSKLSPRQADDAAISAMAESVGDCHTTYFTPRQFQQQLAWIQGAVEFGGIGAVLRKVKPGDPLVIWRVFAGSPAERAGLRGGDIIQAVDGQDVSSLSIQTVVDLIRGPAGQPVQLTIRPAGQKGVRTVTIIRAEIQPPSVEYRLLSDQIGYVQLSSFPENAADQFRQALDALDRQGARAWIIDVRDNGGGVLDAVTRVLSMFLPRDILLFYLYDASGKRTDYRADGSQRPHIPPVVVLTNDGTGSGGEIFAASLQENGIARVVGTRTAGCVGTGQLFSLPGGAGLQVGVARLLTGKGRVLNQLGVTPDVPVDMSVQDLVAGRDPQLARAIQLLETGT